LAKQDYPAANTPELAGHPALLLATSGGGGPYDPTSSNDRNVFKQYLLGFGRDLTKEMISA